MSRSLTRTAEENERRKNVENVENVENVRCRAHEDVYTFSVFNIALLRTYKLLNTVLHITKTYSK